MKHYQHLIAGGGMAGDAAVRGIREMDAEGSIGMVGVESDPPYDRPDLTKNLSENSSCGCATALATQKIHFSDGD